MERQLRLSSPKQPVRATPVPEVLYKYCHPDRIDVIENRRIRFTQPSLLNDPVESLERYLDVGVSWDEFYRDFSLIFPNDHGIEEWRDFGLRIGDEGRALMRRRVLQIVFDVGTGVLSLSATRDNQAMWSHYADIHQGIAFGFNSNSYFFRKRKHHLGPVNYRENIPIASKLHMADLETLLFFKTAHWSYEQEWRVVKPLIGKKPIHVKPISKDSPYLLWLEPFPASMLTSVIFGCRSSQSTRDRALGVLSRTEYSHVTVYQASYSPQIHLEFRVIRPPAN